MIGNTPGIGTESPSNPFVTYYEKQSTSPATIAHFQRLKAMLLRVLSPTQPPQQTRVLV